MKRNALISSLLVSTVVAAGITVVLLAYFYGRAIVLLLIATLFVILLLHARTGSGTTMAMESGGGESDYTEVDTTPSRIDIGSSVPGARRTTHTLYLLGLVLWSFPLDTHLTIKEIGFSRFDRTSSSFTPPENKNLTSIVGSIQVSLIFG